MKKQQCSTVSDSDSDQLCSDVDIVSIVSIVSIEGKCSPPVGSISCEHSEPLHQSGSLLSFSGTLKASLVFRRAHGASALMQNIHIVAGREHSDTLMNIRVVDY